MRIGHYVGETASRANVRVVVYKNDSTRHHPPPASPPHGPPPPARLLCSIPSCAAEQGEVSANLERLCGLEEEQKRHVHMSEEDPVYARAVAEYHTAALELQGEDESIRKAVEVRVVRSFRVNDEIP